MIYLFSRLCGNGFKFKTFHGGKKPVISAIIKSREETRLPALPWQYGLKNIYNSDEFGQH